MIMTNLINDKHLIIKNNKNIDDQISISSTTAFIIFGIMLAILFGMFILKKIYFYFFHKKRYYVIPRISTKGITNIAMVIAIAVSIIILIMAVTGGLASVFFRAYPGTRVTIEIILVKISGLLFGPVIGLISGAIIDVLTIALSAGFFHYGYFIAAVLTGLIAGLMRSTITFSRVSKFNDLFLALYSTLFIFVSLALTIGILNKILGTNSLQLTLPGLNFQIKLTYIQFYTFLLIICLLSILLIWIVFFVWMYRKRYYGSNLIQLKYKKYSHANHKHSIWIIIRNNWYSSLVSVVALVTSCTFLVNILFLPIFDSEITGQPYTYWLLFRLLVGVFLLILDILIIYPVMLFVTPIMKYNYEDELIDELDTPLYYTTWKTNKEKVLVSEKIILECSQSLLFSINDKQLDQLIIEFNDIIRNFDRVSIIDTTNLEPTSYSINFSIHDFREDIPMISDISAIMQCPEKVNNQLVKVY